MLDIATNKLMAITQRAQVKDYVDLYFLLKEFSIWDLKVAVEVKFGVKTEPFFIASDFLAVEEFDVLPTMIEPLTLPELRTFFRKEAKKLGKTIVE